MILKRTLLIAFTFLSTQFNIAFAQSSDGKSETLFEIMKQFSNAIYQMAERNGGSVAQWNAAEANTLKKLEDISLESKHLLAARNKKGQTLLMMASYLGYSFIVDFLVQAPAVYQEINAVDDDGLTAYDHGSLAIKQTLMACHPKLENPFVFIPFVVTQPYYKDRSPYQKILESLKKFNGAPNQDVARIFWLKNCTNDDADTLRQVKISPNLLETLLIANHKVLFKKEEEKIEKLRSDIQKLVDTGVFKQEEADKYIEKRLRELNVGQDLN